MYELAVIIVVLGLIFDYTNGMHDSANVVSTSIATKALKPLTAIILAAILNTIGATQISAVAHTITKGLIHTDHSAQGLIVVSILGAILWNITTAYMGLPGSSSYALVGGLLGASIQHKGFASVLWHGVFGKVVIPMIVSPFIGFALAFLLMKMFYPIFKNHQRVCRYFQIGSSSLVALSHGFNDAQKSMAIITLGLFTSGIIAAPTIPFWVIVACALTMGIGTATGGFQIIHTVGYKLTKLEPVHGFSSELSSPIVIISAALLGMPISSTQMIVGSVSGVGSVKGFSAIRWLVVNKLIVTWVLTIPCSGLVASLLVFLFNHFYKKLVFSEL